MGDWEPMMLGTYRDLFLSLAIGIERIGIEWKLAKVESLDSSDRGQYAR